MRNRLAKTVLALAVGAVSSGMIQAQSGPIQASNQVPVTIVSPAPNGNPLPLAPSPPQGPATGPLVSNAGPVAAPVATAGMQAEGITISETVAPAHRIYGGVDYLLWWMKQPGLNTPLVTTGNPSADNPGAIGDPTTQNLLGPGGLHYPLLSGVRGTVGFWLDDVEKTSLELSGFWLQQAQAHYQASSDANGSPLLANPLNFLLPGMSPVAGASLITYPGGYNGGISVRNTTGLWGAEVDLARSLYQYDNGNWQLNVRGLAGFRYLNLEDTMGITASSSAGMDSLLPVYFQGNSINLPASIGTNDQFKATNHFYGFQLGLNTQASYGKWSLGIGGKVAFGPNQEIINVQGSSALYQPGQAPLNAVGGIYAQPSNIGRYSSTVFDIVPEVESKLSYRLGNHTQLSVGYNFLYFNRVVRAADQLDLRSDVSQIPSGNVFYTPGAGQYPLVPFHQTNLWAQGLTFGCRFDF